MQLLFYIIFISLVGENLDGNTAWNLEPYNWIMV